MFDAWHAHPFGADVANARLTVPDEHGPLKEKAPAVLPPSWPFELDPDLGPLAKV